MSPLDSQRWKRIEPILDRALELSGQERVAWLDEACGDDAQLRAEVEELLTAEVRGRALLETDARAPQPEGPSDPETVGPYRILSRLGAGGMGVVYLAEQSTPVERRVALKLIRLGMNSEEIIRRFEAERQALARMDHPNIARFLDAGTTPEGQPYFVMEYVEGCRITEHCEREALDTRRRLELFATVCRAVQHAHRRGVLHRDLKPSNVLVASSPDGALVKVIDFGIAKAIGDPLTEGTPDTRLGQLVGTPAYMSPEQADAGPHDLDTRTDVYSLGVLLYQLLTGTLPFDPEALHQAGPDEMRRILRDTDPPRPSERLRTQPSATVSDAAVTRGALRGDLDWIVMRAMARERERRYDSAAEIADDLERHLDNRPVLAGPPGAGYRVRKFLRRHRIAAGVGATVALALLVTLLTVSWALVESNRQRSRTEQALTESREATRFLTDMFNAANPRMGEGKGRDMTVLAVLEGASEQLEGRFSDAPRVEARLRFALGQTYFNLGEYDRSRVELERGRELIEDDEEAEARIRVQMVGQLADAYSGLALYDEAAATLEASQRLGERLLGADDDLTLELINNHAVLMRRRGHNEEAIALLETYLERAGPRLDVEDVRIVRARANLANAHRGLNQFDEAEALFAEVFSVADQVFAAEDPEILAYRNNYANLLDGLQRYEESIPIYEQIAAAAERTLGADHPWRLTFLNNLAAARHRAGDYERAETDFRMLADLTAAKMGADHPNTLNPVHNLGHVLRARGDEDGAERMFRRAFEGRRRALGEEHPLTMQSRLTVARLCIRSGRLDEADRLLREVPASQAERDDVQQAVEMLRDARAPSG